jgi:ABC-type dipeptide/oligopeptide/nickel transport system permease subunit
MAFSTLRSDIGSRRSREVGAQRPGPIRAFMRRHPVGMVGAGLVVMFVVAGVLAPHIMPYDPNQIDVHAMLQPPSRAHLLGTDNQGRDLLSRVIFGARMSLLISMTSVGFGAVVGVLLGVLAGYYRSLDGIIMRLNDVLLAFPSIIVALTIVAILGTALANVIAAIAITQVPQYVRLAQGLTLSIKDRPYVEAAMSVGATDRIILARYIFPNCLAAIVVQTSLLIPGAIMTAATLSFLGLGVQPPTAEWGAMLENNLEWAQMAPQVMVIPGLALMAVVLGFNVLGDALRDAMDPRLRTGGGTPLT